MSLTTRFNELRGSPIAVIGSGAIGRAVACMLSHTGHDVTLVGRDDSIAELCVTYDRDAGMTFRTPDLPHDVKAPMAFRSYSQIQSGAFKPNLVIYSVKAGYLPDVIQITKPMISTDTKSIFLQGGVPWWSGYTTPQNLRPITDPHNIGRKFNLDNTYAALVSFGADVIPGTPEISRLKSNSLLTFGAIQPNENSAHMLQALKALFDNRLVQPSISDNLFPVLWSKAAGSFAMSSFALITGKTLGEMMADEAIFLQMVDAATQLQNTGRALGVRENTNYREYLSNMGKKLPNHMMTITKDPSEHEAIIDMPIRIAKALGEDTSKLESIAAQSRRAADRLKSRNSQPQPQ